jgi:hypothetical protein
MIFAEWRGRARARDLWRPWRAGTRVGRRAVGEQEEIILKEDLERIDELGMAAWDDHKPDAFVDWFRPGRERRGRGVQLPSERDRDDGAARADAPRPRYRPPSTLEEL